MKVVKTNTPNIYSFSVQNIEGDLVELSQYKGKVLLIVNTASECGFTPQYKELEELYKLYKDKGFEILAFPSNDFGKQEPLEGKNLKEFCDMHFRITFPLFDKVTVTGFRAIPLFQFLSTKQLNGKVNISPKWNFQKYLINRNGEVVDYFFPFTRPTSGSIRKAIERLL
ncbi:MAG: glutathione peroxidase [Bacteroidota bacterium]